MGSVFTTGGSHSAELCIDRALSWFFPESWVLFIILGNMAVDTKHLLGFRVLLAAMNDGWNSVS